MKQPVYYMQTDKRWGSLPYSITGDQKQTIAYSGCGPTCMAMIAAEWCDPDITPPMMCKLAIEVGSRTPSDGTAWSFYPHMAKRYNLEFKQTGVTQDAVAALRSGALVVCSMAQGYFASSGGHFILAWGVDGDNILVNDPISTKRTKASIDTFRKECKQYFIFNMPVPKKEDKPMQEKPITGEQAVQILFDNKVIASPDYWLNAIKVVKHLDLLLIKIVKNYDLKG